MRYTRRNTKGEDGLIHITESYAKTHVWTWCSQVYPHEDTWTKRAPTCLTCIALAGETKQG